MPAVDSSQQDTARENAARIAEERRNSMAEAAARAALRASGTKNQQISPSPTPSRNAARNTATPQLSQAVREQWGLPEEKMTKPKTTLADIKAIGQSLKNSGVTVEQGLQPDSRTPIENSFDKGQEIPSNSEPERLSQTQKARLVVQNNRFRKPPKSVDWER